MAIIDTGLLTKGLRSEFFSRFDAAPARYRQFATRVASNGHSEVYRWLGSTPQMRPWGDGRLARGLRSESYSLENLKYEATLEVDRDEIADDQTGQIRVRVGELAERAATHKDLLIARLLDQGAEAGYHSYDGVPFFSADHASGDGGTQTNRQVAGVSDPSAPTSTEFRSALAQAITQLLALKDERGEPMALDADGLCCVVPPNMLFTALEAMSATLANGAANVLAAVAPVVSFPWLASTNRWYLLKTNGVVRPFIFQDREPIEFTALAEDSEEGFKREKFLYGVRARYRIAYGYWQFAVQTQFELA